MHWRIFHGIFIKFHGSAHGILQESHNIFIAQHTAAQLKGQSNSLYIMCDLKLNINTPLRTLGKYSLQMRAYFNISAVRTEVQHLKELKHHVVQMRRHINHSNGFIKSFNCRGNTRHSNHTSDSPCGTLMVYKSLIQSHDL